MGSSGHSVAAELLPADWLLHIWPDTASQSMFSFRLLLSSAAVIEQHHLTQTNDAEIKMKNDKLNLEKKKINVVIMRS